MNSKYSIIRLISFLLIFICHIFQYYNNVLSSYFNIGVIVFFVLSGYLYGTKEIENKKRWYFKQYIKIILPYIILLVTMLILEKYVLGKDYSLILIIKSFLGLQGTTTIKTLSHTWFITYILLCYLITPFLNYLFKDKKHDKTSYLIIISSLVIIQFLNFANFTNINIAYLFSYIYGYISSRLNLKNKYIYILGIASLFIRIMLDLNLIDIAILNNFGYLITTWTNAFIGISIFSLLLKIKEVKYNKILKYSDKFCYCFYLTHQIFILNNFSLMQYSFVLPLLVTIISGISLWYVSKYIQNFISEIQEKNKETNLMLYLLIFLIIINPFLDLYYFNGVFSTDIFGITIPTLIRFTLIGTIILIYIIKYKDYKKILIYGFLLIIYLVLQFINCNTENYNLILEIKNIIVLVIPFVLGYTIYKSNINEIKISKALEITSWILSLLIVVPTIFGFGICSYINQTIEGNFFSWFTTDLGYMVLASKGLFYTSIISCSVLILIPYIYYLHIKTDKLKYIILIFLLSLASIMIGTKAASYGVLLVLIGCFGVEIILSIFRKPKINYRKIATQAIMSLMIIIIFINAPITSRVESDSKKQNQSKEESDLLELKITDNNKIINCNDYSDDFIIQKIEEKEELYIPKKYINKIYSYKKDPKFWCNIINNYTIIEQQNNRFLQKNIVKRLIELNNNPNDKYLGYGYSKITKIHNVERDFLYQYYTYGILGSIIICGIYIISLIICGLGMILNNKINYINCLLMIGLGFFIFFAYYSGNTLGNLGVTIIIGIELGLLYKNVFMKKGKKHLKENKITILALHLGSGGVEKFFSSLVKMLETNYEIEIISSYKVSNEPAFDFGNAKVKYLIEDRPYKQEFKKAIKTLNLKDIIKYGIKNAKILLFKTTREIDAIQHIDSKYIITTRFHSKLVGKLLDNNCIKIATEHNYHDNNKKYINKIIRSVRNFDYLVCVSEELKNFYKDKVGKTKTIYIPNVIDNIPEYKTKKINNKIISVGRLSSEKGFDDLIDVMKYINEENSKIKLTLVGDGKEKDNIKQKIRELNLEDNINLTGTLSSEEVYEQMQQSSLYVMTSHTESFGIVLLEAMANGLPCVAFDSANGAKMLLSKKRGMLIKNRNKKKMAKEILELLNDKKKYLDYSKKGYEYCQEFSIEKIKEKWFDLFKKTAK